VSPSMKAPSLRWVRLTLAGFGAYEQPTTFDFPEGPAVWIAPNESGKSTLAHGIAAVLFGLPGVTDPTRFGAGRFRSFGHPDAFFGELEWREGETGVTLHRRFDTHRVTWTDERNGQRTVVFEGEHNPQARSSAGSAFARLLRERLGISDLDLFLETFCLAQPLTHGESLSHELQHLISGSRATRVDEVLGRLFARLKERTKATGDLGVARPGTSKAVNQTKDGLLEQAVQRFARLRQDFEEGRNQLDGLNAQNEELEASAARRQELVRSIEERTGRLEVLRRWLDTNDDRRRRRERVERSETAGRESSALAKERAELELRLRTEFPAFAQAPADLGARLETLERAAEARERGKHDRMERAAERRRLGLDANAAEARLQNEFGDVRGRSDLAELRARLEEATARSAARRERRVEAEREIESMRARLSSVESTGHRCEELRSAAHAITEDLQRLRQIEARRLEIESATEGERFLESEGRLELLREKHQLEQSQRETGGRLRETRAELAAAEERSVRPSVSTRSSASGGGFAAIPIWVGLLVAALAGAVVYFAADGNFALGLSAAGVAIALFVGARAIADRAGARGAVRTETSAQTAPDGEQGNALLAVEALRSQMEKLRAEEKRLAVRMDSLRQSLGPFREMTATELATFEERWRLLAEETQRLSSERDQRLRSRLGLVAVSDWEEVLVERLPAVARDLVAPGVVSRLSPDTDPPATLGEMAAWLESLDPSSWDRWREDESAAEELRHKLESLDDEARRLRVEEDGADSVERLRERYLPFTLASDPARVIELQGEAAAVERQLQTSRLQLAALPDPSAEDAASVAEERLESEAWEAVRAVWPCDRPAEPLEEWARAQRGLEQPAREARQRLEEKTTSTERLLRSLGLETEAQRAAQEIEERAALGAVVLELSGLEEREPLLAGARDLTDPLERAQRLHDLAMREQQSLDAEKKARETEEENTRRILRSRASLEGARPANLAHVELEIASGEAELARLRREIEGVRLAHRWVAEAAHEYQAEYRGELEAKITESFQKLTGTTGRSVEIAADFGLSLRRSNGAPLAMEQLSQGARDQLVLAVRLALADLLAGAVPLPLVFDDPFVHFDSTRRVRLRSSLQSLSRDRQWILLSYDDDFATWGRPLAVERSAGVRSAGPV